MSSSSHFSRAIARSLVGATFILGGCAALPDALDTIAGSTESTLAKTMPTSVAEAMVNNLAPLTADSPTGQEFTVDLANPTGDGVLVNDGVLTLSKIGSYTLRGSWAGQVVVDPGGGQVDLTLDGATIASSIPGALVIQNAETVVVHLAEGSENSLSDVGIASEDDKDPVEAALYSHATLVLTGTGKLNVTSANGDAVASKDGLVIESGIYNITAGDDGIRGKDYLAISDGTLNIRAVGDALKSTNNSDETAGYVLVSGGDITASADDDCMNAQTDALISGGRLTFACGGDGVHAEMATIIDGGELTVTKSGEGIEGFYIVLAGGVIDVTSSDDGVNASGGTTESETAGDAVPGEISSGVAPNQPWGEQSGWPSEMPTDLPSGFAPGQMPTDFPTDIPTASTSEQGAIPAPGTRPDRGPGGAGGFDGNSGASGFAGNDGGFGGEGDGGQVLLISGGDITINAEGDGLDSNGSGSMTGGTVTVYGPTRAGNGGLDVGAGLVISGGTLLAVDSGGMSTTPGTSSPQAWFSARASVSGALTITDSSGRTVAEYTLPKGASTVVFSSSSLVTGETYTLISGAQTAGEATAR